MPDNTAVEVNDAKVQEIIKSIEEMSVLQLSQLVKALENRFGVTAAAPVAVAAGGPAAAAAAPVVEEQTEFDVVLKSAGANKINVIKNLPAGNCCFSGVMLCQHIRTILNQIIDIKSFELI